MHPLFIGKFNQFFNCPVIQRDDAEEVNEDDPTFEYVANQYLNWYEKRRNKHLTHE